MVAFSFFGFSIYWYGIFYFIAFLLFYLFLYLLPRFSLLDYAPGCKKFLKQSIDDVFLYAVGGGILGGRLGYIFIYDFEYYFHHPLKVFAVNEGGMAFIGGILGVIGALFFLRYIKNLVWKNFFFLLDIFVLVVPLGIILGRIGNYLNQEIYGIVVNTDFLHSLLGQLMQSFYLIHVYPQVDTLARFNTNFLAIIFEGIIPFLVLLRLFFRRYLTGKLYPGFLSGLFLFLYSFFRFFLEYLRQDSQFEFIFYFTKSQWFFIVFFIFSLFLMQRSKKWS